MIGDVSLVVVGNVWAVYRWCRHEYGNITERPVAKTPLYLHDAQFIVSGYTTTTVHLRQGPGAQFPVRRVLPAGYLVTLLGQRRGSWFRIRVRQDSGWVHGDFVVQSGTWYDIQHGWPLLKQFIVPKPTIVRTAAYILLAAIFYIIAVQCDVDREKLWQGRLLVSISVFVLSNHALFDFQAYGHDDHVMGFVLLGGICWCILTHKARSLCLYAVLNEDVADFVVGHLHHR